MPEQPLNSPRRQNQPISHRRAAQSKYRPIGTPILGPREFGEMADMQVQLVLGQLSEGKGVSCSKK